MSDINQLLDAFAKAIEDRTSNPSHQTARAYADLVRSNLLDAIRLQTPEAVTVVCQAMRDDPGYAWSWHCNIAMAFVDAGGDAYTANQGAARFIRTLAGVEPAHELPVREA